MNLLVRDVKASLPFYRDVLGATVRYADEDFAAMNLAGAEFMLHRDHAYDHHPIDSHHHPHGWRDVMVADPDGYEWAVALAK